MVYCSGVRVSLQAFFLLISVNRSLASCSEARVSLHVFFLLLALNRSLAFFLYLEFDLEWIAALMLDYLYILSYFLYVYIFPWLAALK